jgi:hypothetical protein
MDAYLDGLLDELVPAAPHEGWDDVVRRARRARRRYTALVALVAALVLVPAAWTAANAFEGTPPPPDVATNFSDFNQFRRIWIQHDMAISWPQVDVSKAHGVVEIQTADGPEQLWAAPDDQGGQCYFIDWANDPPARYGKFGISGCEPPQPPATEIAFDEVWVPSHSTLTTVYGNVYVEAATVQVTLDDGSTQTLPVLENLFLGSFPKGAQVEKATAVNASGDVVATWTPPG